MKTMTKIAIGTVALAAFSLAAAAFSVDVPWNVANAGTNADSGKGILHPAASDTTSRFEVAQAAPQLAASQGSSLPGGASSLRESYQDWMVMCATQPAAEGQPVIKRCAMSQQQASQQGGQRVLAIEMKPTGTAFEAALFLPFGLALDKGVTLQIDEGQPSNSYRFQTCLPAGCIVPLTFDSSYVAVLQKGTSLRIKAVSDGGAETPFSVSLKGFAAAAARVAALTK